MGKLDHTIPYWAMGEEGCRTNKQVPLRFKHEPGLCIPVLISLLLGLKAA